MVKLIALVILCCGLKTVFTKQISAPRYVLDLDLPPKTRWQPIMANYDTKRISDEMKYVLKYNLRSDTLIYFLTKIASGIDKYFSEPYGDEIRGMSEILGLDLGTLVIFNMFYDVLAHEPYIGKDAKYVNAGTSIVSMDKNGNIIHGRNFDFLASEYLRNVTMVVDFQRNGKTIYTGTTFAGVIGLMTGEKSGVFSMSLNQRNTGFWWDNFLAILDKSSVTMLFFRKILEEAKSYDHALHLLKTMDTLGPGYFIVGGVKPYEGAIVIGDRWGSIGVAPMNESLGHNWFIVETNYEPWNDPPKADDRRDAAVQLMQKIGQENMEASSLLKVLSVPPILNSDTVYTTLMSAGMDSTYKTIVRNPESQ